MSSHPFFASGRAVIAMAHRGFHGPGVTENTLEAFERAIVLGYRYIESDLHLTRDGVVVMAHDPDLARVAGSREQIADLTWSELSTRRLIHGERIPRLDEVLAAWPELHLNLDAKVSSVVEPAARAVRSQQAHERVCFGSFSHRTVLALRGYLPHSAHSASPLEVALWRSGRLRRFALADRAPHAFMVPTRSGPIPVVTTRTIERAHEHQMSVHVWTVNEPEEIRRLVRLGVDGVMTDRADLLKDVLREESRWA